MKYLVMVVSLALICVGCGKKAEPVKPVDPPAVAPAAPAAPAPAPAPATVPAPAPAPAPKK